VCGVEVVCVLSCVWCVCFLLCVHCFSAALRAFTNRGGFKGKVICDTGVWNVPARSTQRARCGGQPYARACVQDVSARPTFFFLLREARSEVCQLRAE
jgi:hypothetical protein